MVLKLFLLIFVTLKNNDGIRMPDLAPDEPFKLNVKIIDISGNAASAKAQLSEKI
jgi:hypothetical protein